MILVWVWICICNISNKQWYVLCMRRWCIVLIWCGVLSQCVVLGLVVLFWVSSIVTGFSNPVCIHISSPNMPYVWVSVLIKYNLLLKKWYVLCFYKFECNTLMWMTTEKHNLLHFIAVGNSRWLGRNPSITGSINFVSVCCVDDSLKDALWTFYSKVGWWLDMNFYL
jgi:hypothetical protein